MPYKDSVKAKEYSKKYHREHPEKKKKYNEKYRKNNAEKIREYRREYDKKYYRKHPQKIKECVKKHYEKYIKQERERSRKYQKEHPEKARERNEKRLGTLKGKIDSRMSNAIWKALKGNKKGRKWESLVGYTVDQLKQHIQKQFTKGMNWTRFKKGEIHIHHDVPKSYFNCTSTDDPLFKECWVLHNLKPLWAKDNISKGDRNYQLPLLLEQK